MDVYSLNADGEKYVSHHNRESSSPIERFDDGTIRNPAPELLIN